MSSAILFDSLAFRNRASFESAPLLSPYSYPLPSTELAPVEDNLANSLVQRFWGEEGYSLHSEFPAFLDSLRSLGIPPPSIVSNTDPALVRILDNLGVSKRRIGAKGILKEEIFTTWALEKEKQEVGFWHDVLKKLDETSGKGERLKPEEVLVVGDELIAFVSIVDRAVVSETDPVLRQRL